MGNESEVKIKMGITGTEDVLSKVNKVEQGFKQNQKALIALATGFGIATIIDKFSGSITEAISRSNQLGLLTQRNTEIFSRYSQATRELSQAKSRLSAELASVLAPALTSAANAASGMVNGMSNIAAGSASARAAILGVAGAVGTLGAAISASKVAGLLGLSGTGKFLGRAGVAGAVAVGSYQAGQAAGQFSYGGSSVSNRLAAGFLDAQMRWEQLQNKLFGSNNLEKIQALREEMTKLLYPEPDDSGTQTGGILDRADLEMKRQAIQLQIDENNQISERNQLDLNGNDLDKERAKQQDFNESKIAELRALSQQAYNAKILTATEYREMELRDTGALLNIDKERYKVVVATDQRELARLTQQRQSKVETENFLFGLVDSNEFLTTTEKRQAKMESLAKTIEFTNRELAEYDKGIESLTNQDQIDIAQKGRQLYESRLQDLQLQQTAVGQTADPASFRDQMRLTFTEIQEQFGTTAQIVARGFGSIVGSAVNGLASSIKGLLTLTMTWGEALRNIGISIVQGIIDAFAKMVAEWIMSHIIMEGIAWAFSQAMVAIKWLTTGEEIAAEETKTGVLGINAVLNSIASDGVGAAIGIAAFVAALGVGIAAASGAFETGGYTGNMGVKDVAGVVHGQEYVFSAPAVKAIGLSNLEQLHKTGAMTDSLIQSGGPAGGAKVIIVDSRQKARDLQQTAEWRDAVVQTVGENRHRIS